MSRHRNVRTMNYQDEYDGYDDVYGHSVEDDHYCVSPGTASQFLYDRTTQNQNLFSFIADESEPIPEEEEVPSDLKEKETIDQPRNDTLVDKNLLNDCLEKCRDVLGDSIPEKQLESEIIKSNYNSEIALNSLLTNSSSKANSSDHEPKPQREHRKSRFKDDSIENILLFNKQNSFSKQDFDFFEQFSPVPICSTDSYTFVSSCNKFNTRAISSNSHCLTYASPSVAVSTVSFSHPSCFSSSKEHLSSFDFSMPRLNSVGSSGSRESLSQSPVLNNFSFSKSSALPTSSLTNTNSIVSQSVVASKSTSSDKSSIEFKHCSKNQKEFSFLSNLPKSNNVLNSDNKLTSFKNNFNSLNTIDKDVGKKPLDLSQLAKIVKNPSVCITNKLKEKDNNSFFAKSGSPSNMAKVLAVTSSEQKHKIKTFKKNNLTFLNLIHHKNENYNFPSQIVPFDFTTLSPDDIVKNKQSAAFTRKSNQRMNVSSVSSHSDKTSNSADLPPPPTINIDLSQTVTRMTFSSGKQTQSGFTPEKVIDSISYGGSNKETESQVPNNCSLKPEVSVEDRSNTPEKLSDRDNFSLPTPSRSSSKTKYERVDISAEYEKRKASGKNYLNLVVVGHVDAGKSTLMGHLLFQLGFVNKKSMHKYEAESKKMGKSSFAYAWVLDETEEERSRGVTMDVASIRFETDNTVVTLLDAPGHKDFIPNMITGAAQADVAILVLNSAKGEFETGFEMGGQTREHAMLIRSLGVSQLLVAVNKMDAVNWEESRFTEVSKKVASFLRQAGFKESDVTYVPCSGLIGDNLTKKSDSLSHWYSGPTILDGIDQFKAPSREVLRPFRMCVSDVFKSMGAGHSVCGTIQSGSVQPGDKVIIMPQSEPATVKGILINEVSQPCAFDGDNIVLVVSGIDMTKISVGSILCESNNLINVTTRFRARIVIFNFEIPITKGFQVVMHYQSLTEPASIRKLVSLLNKSSGDVLQKNPRCLNKNSNAIIEIEVNRPICLEKYKDFKNLGRFMLRYSGSTIAAGLVTEVLGNKNS